MISPRPVDNVTHGLVGLLIGEGVVAMRRSRRDVVSSTARRAMVWASIAGNEGPDLDFVYTGVTGGRLGYLLHHRGHTHTLVAAIPIALLALGVVALALKLRQRHLTAGDWRWVAGLSLLGPLVHMAMDFANNYGVHPFWPFFSGWSYGDSLFIVEPLLFVAMIPPLALNAESRTARVILWSLLVAVTLISIAVPVVSWGSVAVIVLCSAGLTAFLRKISEPRRIAVGFAASLLTVAVFAGSSALVRGRTHAWLESAHPGSVIDVVITPAPANPMCFDVLGVQMIDHRLVFTTAKASAWPMLMAPQSCPDQRGNGTFPLREVTESPNWLARMRSGSLALDEIRSSERDDCRFAAFLKWSRVPFVLDAPGGRIAGDLRYDREPGLGFAELDLEPHGKCPRFVPGWRPPRSDVLR